MPEITDLEEAMIRAYVKIALKYIPEDKRNAYREELKRELPELAPFLLPH